MDFRNRDRRATGQETALLDYMERVGRLRDGRRLVHLHLSQLRPHHRQEHHLRFAATILDRFARKYDGAMFWLSNDDMVLVTKDASMAEVDEAVMRLRLLFGDDPLVAGEADGETGFCSWYDLEAEYEAALAAATGLQSANAQAAPTAGPTPPAGTPLDPAHLAEIERSIAIADLSNFVRRQPVCFVAPGRPPITLFEELFVSIADLRRAVIPDYDIVANRWLFQHLTQILDLRMLALLTRSDGGTPLKNFSVNLNIATILAPEFLEFDANKSKENRGTIAIELQQIDIFADIGNYMFARDYLSERGYKLCLDGVKHQTLPLIDRERLGVDLVKFLWGPDLVDDLKGPRGAAIRESVARIGRDRLILCRCDSPLAAEIGASLGITMYQGRYFDGLLRAGASAAAAKNG